MTLPITHADRATAAPALCAVLLVAVALVISTLAIGTAEYQPRPAAPPPTAGRNFLRLPIKDGMIRLSVRLNGVKFDDGIIDTGATSLAIGAKTHAPRLGIKPSSLIYDRRLSTANGIVRGASFTFRTVEIGDGLVLKNVPGVIDEGELDSILLGQSFVGLLPGGLELHHDYAILWF